MIHFHYETDFKLKNIRLTKQWLSSCIAHFNAKVGNINYIYCTDDYLLTINQQHLQHNAYTDIITFDYSDNNHLSSDIYISIDRVQENAHKFHTDFDSELHRVMIHGILHLVGFKDKTDSDKIEMRTKENEMLLLRNHKMFHVEH